MCFRDGIAESAKIRCVHIDGKECDNFFSYRMIKYVDGHDFPITSLENDDSLQNWDSMPLTLGVTFIIVQYLGYFQLQSFKKWKGISWLG